MEPRSCRPRGQGTVWLHGCHRICPWSLLSCVCTAVVRILANRQGQMSSVEARGSTRGTNSGDDPFRPFKYFIHVCASVRMLALASEARVSA